MNETNHNGSQGSESILGNDPRPEGAPLRDFGPVNLQSDPMSKKKKMVFAALGVVALAGAAFATDLFDFSSHPKPEVSLSPQAPATTEPQAAPSEPVQVAAQGMDAAASAANPAQPAASQAAMGISTKPIELTAAQMALAAPAPSPASEEVLNKVGEVLEAMKELKEEVKTLRAQVRRADAGSSKPKAEPMAKSEMIAVTVVEVSPTALILMTDGRKVTLRIGEKMPGGAVFLGFDQSARKLKTDQGDFTIPS